MGLGEGLTHRNDSQSFRLQTRSRKFKNFCHPTELLSRRGSIDDFNRSASLPITFKDDFTPWEFPD